MKSHHFQNDAIEAFARVVERSPDHRVLRRLPRHDEMWLAPMPAGGADVVVGVIDCETTGLSAQDDAMIEFAIVKMALCADGVLVDIAPPVAMLEDPGRLLPPEIEAITGITDAMLKGERIADESMQPLLNDVDVLVSHNARFDRGFLVRRFPWIAHPWACTLVDINWRDYGLEGRALGHLLASAGHFNSLGHRAGPDAWALACLLAHCNEDGRTIAAELIARARRPRLRLFARRAPFELRALLTRVGYRWDAARKAWWIEGDEERITGERAFLRSFDGAIETVTKTVDWFTRHAD